MSAVAQGNLQKLWEKLHFSTVRRTIANEPEDILDITVHQLAPGGALWPNGTRMHWGHRHPDFPYGSITRTSEIPEGLKDLTDVAWRHFYGFTDDNIYFQREDFHGLDLDIDVTCRYSNWSNSGHKGTYDRPEDGTIICGEVIEAPKGKRFVRWFTCDQAFVELVKAVRGETKYSDDNELGKLLFAGEKDEYWAIARLVLFDNTSAFADQLDLHRYEFKDPNTPDAYRHPAAGMEYGNHGFTCHEYGMRVPRGVPQFLHELSHTLGEPKWWDDFLQECDERNLDHGHPAHGGICNACEAQRDQWDYTRLDYADH